MTVEAQYMEIYNLGEKMKTYSTELNQDMIDIDTIAESLIDVLHGEGQVAIYNRIKNFNGNEFKKVVNYTQTLGEILVSCAKNYNSLENEFEGQMKKEALNYEQ